MRWEFPEDRYVLQRWVNAKTPSKSVEYADGGPFGTGIKIRMIREGYAVIRFIGYPLLHSIISWRNFIAFELRWMRKELHRALSPNRNPTLR